MTPARLWAPPAVLAGVIYVLSSLSQVPGDDYVWDKLAHVAVFALLAALTLRATHGGFRPLRSGRTGAAAALVVGWGALDELHQRFVPGRHPSSLDVVADAVGVGLAIALWTLWVRRIDRSGREAAARIARARGGMGGEG